jgi:hypothetical protein
MRNINAIICWWVAEFRGHKATLGAVGGGVKKLHS